MTRGPARVVGLFAAPARELAASTAVVLPLGQDQSRLAAVPLIAMRQKPDQLVARQLRQIESRDRLRPVGHEFVDATVRPVPVVLGIDVVGPLVVPVGDEQAAVRPDRAIDRPEGMVVGRQQLAAEDDLRSLNLAARSCANRWRWKGRWRRCIGRHICSGNEPP